MKNVLAYDFYQKFNNLYPVEDHIIERAMAHAIQVFPKESVGVVASNQYHPLDNASDDPTNTFEVRTRDWRTIEKEFGKLDAVIHSHPKGQPSPSKSDMETQLAFGIPFGIVVMDNNIVRDVLFWGDQVVKAPYCGRPFKNGVYDCYELGRDWYLQEAGIRLASNPRNDLWWENPDEPDMFSDRFRDMGFHEIEFSSMRVGDVFLGSVLGGDRINHCGIYIGEGRILHHLYGDVDNPRVSGTDVVYSWKRFIRKCLRYKEPLQVLANRRYDV